MGGLRVCMMVVMACALPAGAQPDVEQARALATEARAAFTDEPARAATLYQEAWRRSGVSEYLYNAARAHRRAGALDAAIAALDQFLVGEAPGELRVRASTLRTALIAERRAAPVEVRLETDPPGARVLIGGVALEEATPTSARLPPGPHLIRFEKAGRRPKGETLDVAPGRPARLVVSLAPLDETPAIPAAAAVTASPAPPPDGGPSLGWGVVAAGGAALVAAGTFTWLAHDAAADADALADEARVGDADRAAVEAARETARGRESVATILYASGGAVLAAGLTWALWPSGDLAAQLGPGGVGLGGRF